MALRTNHAMQSTLKKRDKTYSELVFNREFPAVQDALLTRKNTKRLKQLELKGKKRLLPLEIEALPAAERNAVKTERELAAFDDSQNLPRRAVEQDYLRKVKKSGEEAAEQFRAGKLKKLDDARAAKVAELEKKYPANVENKVDPAAAAQYEKALAEEEAKLSALSAKLEGQRKEKLKKTEEKLNAKNVKLQARFDAANNALHARSPISEEDFGRDNILSVRNLKMYFSGIKAVDDLSFDIKQGEIFGLIGPNGAGKTTVFNCITQFYHPTGGDVYYRDSHGNIVALNDYKTTDVIKSGIVRTFQNIELVYWLSILDNLLLGVHAFYRSTLADQFLHTPKLKREDEVFRQRAISILERLGIAAYKDMPPMGLPYGVLKKVELARTLMSNPRLIILDEPAAGLNDAETEDLTEIIRVIRDDFNCTIFLVEHDMNLVMNVCDTVCAISFGKMLAIGTPEEIQSDPLVQEAYLGTE
ncbi:MAG: ATP-binding cassette domain-containing protein [Oscillospiraceae bacterium]|nr:ATP-binding cassette domain-containing protein [Oscillospiraceae bacterium]